MQDYTINHLYFYWLCSIAFPNEQGQSHYSNILKLLYETDFIYVVPLDENRYIDGVKMRYHFSCSSKIPEDIVNSELNNKRCSVLEMMVALASRCESIMYEAEHGDRTSEWFKIMFDNLGLSNYPDNQWTPNTFDEVNLIVNKFLFRCYDDFGNGNIFKFNEQYNLKYMELWEQLNLYLRSNIKDFRLN